MKKCLKLMYNPVFSFIVAWDLALATYGIRSWEYTLWRLSFIFFAVLSCLLLVEYFASKGDENKPNGGMPQ